MLRARVLDVILRGCRRGGRENRETTDENARKLTIPLDFLERGKNYEAQIYRDGPDADYLTNPTSLVIEKRRVSSKDRIDASLAAGGGLAVRFRVL